MKENFLCFAMRSSVSNWMRRMETLLLLVNGVTGTTTSANTSGSSAPITAEIAIRKCQRTRSVCELIFQHSIATTLLSWLDAAVVEKGAAAKSITGSTAGSTTTTSMVHARERLSPSYVESSNTWQTLLQAAPQRIFLLSSRWPLVQIRALQSTLEDEYWNHTRLAHDTKGSFVSGSTNIVGPNVLQLSYLASVGKRARGDLPTIVTMLVPLLQSMDGCVDQAFLNADESIRSSDEVERVVRRSLEIRAAAFGALQSLGPRLIGKKESGESRFEETDQFLTVVLHLSWTMSISMELVDLARGGMEGVEGVDRVDRVDKNYESVDHLFNTVEDLKTDMIERGLLRDEKGMSTTFAPLLARKQVSPCASASAEVAEARRAGRQLDLRETCRDRGVAGSMAIANVLELSGAGGEGNVSESGGKVSRANLVDLLLSSPEIRRTTLEAVTSAEWANCHLLHVRRPMSAVPKEEDVASAISRIEVVSRQREWARKKHREEINTDVTSFDVGNGEDHDGDTDYLAMKMSERAYSIRHGSRVLNELESEWSVACLWPTIEASALRREFSMLSELQAVQRMLLCQEDGLVVLEGEREGENDENTKRLVMTLVEIRDKASNWLELCLSKTRRPLVDLMPWQHLVWATSNLAEDVTADKNKNISAMFAYLSSFLQRTITEIESTMHRRLSDAPRMESYESSLSLLGSVETVGKRNKKKRRMIGGLGGGGEGEEELKPRLSSLHASVRLSNVLSVLSKEHAVTVHERKLKIQQLLLASRWVRSSSSSGGGSMEKDTTLCERRTIARTYLRICHVFLGEETDEQLMLELARFEADFLNGESIDSSKLEERCCSHLPTFFLV